MKFQPEKIQQRSKGFVYRQPIAGRSIALLPLSGISQGSFSANAFELIHRIAIKEAIAMDSFFSLIKISSPFY